eukprot:TRINITY_DN138_c0_g1_i1.p1 TRINITY_DN138_c0_g1~~TRINITY_DN138_c0_g1_i1.p1  ORF type:complete len:251 (+),score=21.78 TRINITY_DN138_c0_g1_i1:35-787(+)
MSTGFLVTINDTVLSQLTDPLREEIKRLRLEKDAIEQKYKVLLEYSSEREKEHANEIKQLRDQVANWQATVIQLEKQNREFKMDIIQLDKENREFKIELEKLRNEMDLLCEKRKSEVDHLLVRELARHTEKLLCRHILGEDTKITSLPILFKELKDRQDAKTRWEEFKKKRNWNRTTWNEIWSLMQELKENGLSSGHPCTDFEGNPVTAGYMREITLKVILPSQKQILEEIISTLLCFRPSDNLFANNKI